MSKVNKSKINVTLSSTDKVDYENMFSYTNRKQITEYFGLMIESNTFKDIRPTKLIKQPTHLEIYKAVRQEQKRLLDKSTPRTKTYKHGKHSEQAIKEDIMIAAFPTLTNCNIHNDSLKVSVVNHIYKRIYGYTNTELTRVLNCFKYLNGEITIGKLSHERKKVFNYLQLNANSQLLRDNKEEINRIEPKKHNIAKVQTNIKEQLEFLENLEEPIISAIDRKTDSDQKLFHTDFFERIEEFYTMKNPIVKYWVEIINKQLDKKFKVNGKDLNRYILTRD